ncbi:YncE family protein [Streptomyces sioyaensis]|uniref:YncE family protein n=1 Tax=Streptomyces sioyaensis TaxID=67364 RepID=UPI003F5400EA
MVTCGSPSRWWRRAARSRSARVSVGRRPVVGSQPQGIAITPDGTRAYVTSFGAGSVSVINTANNTVLTTITGVGTNLVGVAITADGTRAYVADRSSNNVRVIDTATNTLIGPAITVGTSPARVAATPLPYPAP